MKDWWASIKTGTGRKNRNTNITLRRLLDKDLWTDLRGNTDIMGSLVMSLQNLLSHLHGHSGHEKFYLRRSTMWNMIKIMRCQMATVITNINVTNTNSSVTEIFGIRPTTDIKFLCVNRFDKIRCRITDILTHNAMIWKGWRR